LVVNSSRVSAGISGSFSPGGATDVTVNVREPGTEKERGAQRTFSLLSVKDQHVDVASAHAWPTATRTRWQDPFLTGLGFTACHIKCESQSVS
jgi:hypothetical protein